MRVIDFSTQICTYSTVRKQYFIGISELGGGGLKNRRKAFSDCAVVVESAVSVDV